MSSVTMRLRVLERVRDWPLQGTGAFDKKLQARVWRAAWDPRDPMFKVAREVVEFMGKIEGVRTFPSYWPAFRELSDAALDLLLRMAGVNPEDLKEQM